MGKLQREEATFRKALADHVSDVLCLRLNNRLNDVEIIKSYLGSLDSSVSILIIAPPAFSNQDRHSQVKDLNFDFYDGNVSWKPKVIAPPSTLTNSHSSHFLQATIWSLLMNSKRRYLNITMEH